MKKLLILMSLMILAIFNTNRINSYIYDFENKDNMFQIVLNTHTVTFLDYFDKPISTITVLNNKSIETNDIPNIEDDIYIFKGWDKDYHNVTVPLWIQAIYEKEGINKQMENNEKNINLIDDSNPENPSCDVFFVIPPTTGYYWSEKQTIKYGEDAIEPDFSKIPSRIIHQYMYENIPSNITTDLTIKPTRKIITNY